MTGREGRAGPDGPKSWAGWVKQKGQSLLGRRGLGRGNEVGYFADWAENEFGLR